MMNNRINKIKEANEVVNHNNPAWKEEIEWLIGITEYYEDKIKQLHTKQVELDNYEIDSLDFSEAVSDIVNSTYIRM